MTSTKDPLLAGGGAPARVNSMSFFAPVNDRTSARGARGVAAELTSTSAEIAMAVAVLLVGIVVAGLVNLMHAATTRIFTFRHAVLNSVRASSGPAAAWMCCSTAPGCCAWAISRT